MKTIEYQVKCEATGEWHKVLEQNVARLRGQGYIVRELVLREDADRLKDQRDQILAFMQNAPVSSGVCCCGDNMERHGNPMNCGHSPVDEWDHSVLCWAKEIEQSDKDTTQ